MRSSLSVLGYTWVPVFISHCLGHSTLVTLLSWILPLKQLLLSAICLAKRFCRTNCLWSAFRCQRYWEGYPGIMSSILEAQTVAYKAQPSVTWGYFKMFVQNVVENVYMYLIFNSIVQKLRVLCFFSAIHLRSHLEAPSYTDGSRLVFPEEQVSRSLSWNFWLWLKYF